MAPGTWVMTVKDPTTGKSGSRMVTSYPLPASAGQQARLGAVFKLPVGATLDDEQMCDHDETTAMCPRQPRSLPRRRMPTPTRTALPWRTGNPAPAPDDDRRRVHRGDRSDDL
jgi:hypothetical protein